MKLSKFILLFFLFFIPVNLFAQTCLLGNRVYTSSVLLSIGSVAYKSSPALDVDGSINCGWTATSLTGNPCKVCSSLLGLICLSYMPGTGQEGIFTMVACPLDDYLPILTLLTVGTGAYYIARKKIYVKT
ncbi:hypothetical protein [Pedobacter frigiditerrae]|uniref:hypothetical protein n=1 Tax=Pedobacter frigiditerrae TaxID=2530452 RepID=UPI0029312F08|nr:hypothetical protein [Pedobacter frigiditerrae]